MADLIDLIAGLLAGISLALVVTGLVVFGVLFYLSREPQHRKLTWSYRWRLPRAVSRLKDRRVTIRGRRILPARMPALRIGVRS